MEERREGGGREREGERWEGERKRRGSRRQRKPLCGHHGSVVPIQWFKVEMSLEKEGLDRLQGLFPLDKEKWHSEFLLTGLGIN